MESVMLPLDFYNIEQSLTDEEKLVQETAREFVDREVLPIIRDCFEKGEFPKPLIKKMGVEGFFGSMLTTYGGAGLGPVAYGLMMMAWKFRYCSRKMEAWCSHSVRSIPP